MNANDGDKRSIGQILLDRGMISRDELRLVLERQASTRKRLTQVVLDLGFIAERDLLEVLSESLAMPIARRDDFPKSWPEGIELSPKYMRQYRFMPLSKEGGKVRIAMVDPFDLYTVDDLRQALGCDVEILLCSESDLSTAMETVLGSGSTTMEMVLEDMQSGGELELLSSEEDEDIDRLRDMAYEAPVIRLVNLLISRAVERNASDIHVEPFESELKVRYRVDGVLQDVESPPKKLQAAVISRLKIMAELNIAERRLPQDGRVRLRVSGKKIDLRVSTVPTMFGESVVMRILDQGSVFLTLTQLGFPEDTLVQFEKMIKTPHGIVLVTGPTGSGKTTTLYAALDKINSPEKKIITVENPVEYQMKGINQIQVNPKIGLTFASGLRHIVRQDPDIIMIGEIRDLETAEIAVQSALTGHLVFSTLHTNDAPGAVTRLKDMGIEHYLIASSLEGVMAQRLVRTICLHCREAARPDPQILKEMRLSRDLPDDLVVYRGHGCLECNNTGYSRRTAIFELLPIQEDVRDLILRKVGSHQLRQRAVAGGMRTLREDGWEKVLAGQTTIDEVIRVTQEEEALRPTT